MTNLVEQWAPDPEWQWAPDPEWQVIRMPQKCRYNSSGGKCPNAAVAAYPRVRSGKAYQPGWYFCADHLYGRRIRDGVVERLVMVCA